MRLITFVPGAVVSPAAITIPTESPDIDAVVSAQIVRLPSGLTIPNHAQADIVAAIADHAVHAHDFISTGIGGAVANAMGLPAGLDAINDAGAAGAHTVPGAGASGVQNNAAAQAHAAGATAVAHGANVGANPVVAAAPTKLTTRTISLDVNTVLGDLLILRYREVGERVLVA